MSIAIITASTRTVRAGPKVADFVANTLTATLPARSTFASVDLQSFDLPLNPKDAGLPAGQTVPLSEAPYASGETNRWSQEIRKHAGIIFVIPEHNSSIPASTKIAIDALYHEWNSKPVLVVSYGVQGGDLAGSHLRFVLSRMHANVVDDVLALSYQEGSASAIPSAVGSGEVDQETQTNWQDKYSAALQSGLQHLVERIKQVIDKFPLLSI